MKTQEFLTENRTEVINFFNNEIKGHWNISMKDFGADLVANFRKITLGDDLKKFDLFGNLQEAKSRLGNFDTRVEVKFDRDAFIAKKYKGTVFAQTLAL